MALPKNLFDRDEPQGGLSGDLNTDDLNNAKRAERRQPYIVQRSIEEEEHRVEVRDDIRMAGTTWAVLGSLLLSFAAMCLIFVGQEMRGGRHLMTTFFWSSLILGGTMFLFGLLRKRSRV